ncbi:response regulator [Cohnella suwonensis]|uniref:Response regulator n=1 Tax=Cohnella suwonensis TaxID=696072 RepID=A0ABW0LY16_9BACL
MNILLADDHPLFRAGVRNLLATTEDLHIVGEASSGHEAVDLAAALRPDVILMDIRMPGLNGIEATKKIKSTLADTQILILTMFKDDRSVFTAMQAGARGYILKDAEENDLLHAIRVVANGGAVFGPDIASRMMDFFAESRPSEPDDPAYAELTSREREILGMIALNSTNAEIASSLHLSIKTVANYVTIILNKLQVSNRKEAKLLAKKWNLRDEDEEDTEG